MPSLSLSASGQPSVVLEAVLVLGHVGALVARVGDAVAVAIAVLLALGAAVLVLIAVAILGDVRAAIVDVENAVVVVVGIGTAVLVLEAVEVFRLVRALVDVVLVAVAVAIADRRLEDEAEHHAHVGGLEAGAEGATTAAEHQEAVLLDEELDAAEELHAELLLRRRSRRP